jgi:formylglycine-generating enzyme required for sulfatase activity
MRAALDQIVRPPPNTLEHPAARPRRRLWVLATVLLLSLGALVWTRTVGDGRLLPEMASSDEQSQVSPPDAEPAAEPPPIEESKLAVLDAHALDDEIKAAYGQLKRGRLFEPEGDNAAERFLALYRSLPQSGEARAGLDAVVDQAAARAEKAIAAGEGARAAKLHDGAASLTERSGIARFEPWTKFKERYAKAAGAALDTAARELDAARVASLAPALDQAAKHRPELAKQRARLANLPKPGQRIADRQGPTLAFVPAAYQGESLDHAFALGTTEVTRADYLAFVEQSKRAMGKCRDGTGLFSYLKRRDVRQPGYEQQNTHPVVCVSLADAEAYAQWLSKRTGQRYRLPTLVEWKHAARGIGELPSPCSAGNVFDRDSAGTTLSNRYECSDGFRFTAPVGKFDASALGLHDIVGNVSEWTSTCAAAKKGRECQALGGSFRDGSKRPLLGEEARDADQGAPDLGFRVLRELTLDTLPAPVK